MKRVKKLAESTNETITKSDVSNGNSNGIARDINIDKSLLTRTPYVSIELNDMINKTVQRNPDKNCRNADQSIGYLVDGNSQRTPSRSPVKGADRLVKSPEKLDVMSDNAADANDKSDDDLPLSKVSGDCLSCFMCYRCELRQGVKLRWAWSCDNVVGYLCFWGSDYLVVW